MAGKANFSIITGDTFSRTCTFRNKTSGTPVNLTGATISGRAATLTMTCAIVNPTSGTFSFGLSSVQTATITGGLYPIEVQVTYPDGTVQTLFTGNLVAQEQTA